MRPKSLIRSRRTAIRRGMWLPDDFLVGWRHIFSELHAVPALMDVRKTLNDLATISAAHLPAALACMGEATTGCMVRGTYFYRKKRGLAASPEAFLFEKYALDEIHEIAKLALEHVPASKGGRPGTADADLQFAVVLALRFQDETGDRPTCTTGGHTPFMLYACNCFAHVGRDMRDPARLLRTAIRLAAGRAKRQTLKRAAPSASLHPWDAWALRKK